MCYDEVGFVFNVFIPGHIPGYQLLAITFVTDLSFFHHSLVEFQEIPLLYYFCLIRVHLSLRVLTVA